MASPCYECPEHDRFIGCHGMCKDYIDFQAANEIKKKNRRDYYNKNGIAIESVLRKGKRNRSKNNVLKTHKK